MRSRLLAVLVVFACTLCAPLYAAQFMTQFQDINPALHLPGTSGGAWGDYDGDGYPDLYLAGSPPTFLNRPDQLFHNTEGLMFTDVSAAVGLSPAIEEDQGVAWGDYDNDGFLDVIVGSGGAFTKLYDNADGDFTERATAAGLNPSKRPGRTVAWCDYDGDGWLDVFVCYAGTSVSALFHNNQDSTFTDVTTAARLLTVLAPDAANDCSWADFDNDGRPDLVVSRGSVSTPSRPALYLNKGNGTFDEVGVQAGLDVVADTLGVAWLDYDNDGWFDLYFCSEQHGRDWLLHNNRDGTFTDVASSAGMAGDIYKGNSVACADYDNDGYEDIFVGNTEVNQPFLYHNNGDGTFSDVAQIGGLGGSHSNLVAIRADMDLDGRVDLFVGVGEPTSRLFHNIGVVGNWLRVRPLTSAAGDATDAGEPTRDAIGARVEVNLDNDAAFPAGSTMTRLVDGGGGYQGQHEPIAQFGPGTSDLVAVRVHFPDGSVVVHRGVAANQQVIIRDVPAGRQEIFTDVPLDYYAYPQILAVKTAGIAGGYPDDTYRPGDFVSRDQMAVYIARAVAKSDASVPAGPATATFTDVPTDYWAFKYVEYAKSRNVVGGYPDGLYHPLDLVDRGQMAIFVARAIVDPTGDDGLASYTPPGAATFPDVPTDYYAYRYIEYIKSKDITGGYPDGKYHPEVAVARDQMAVYVARAFALSLQVSHASLLLDACSSR